MMRTAQIRLLLASVLILFLCLGVALSFSGCDSRKSLVLEETAAALHLWNYCQIYASEHEMRFPANFDQLVELGLLSKESLHSLSMRGNSVRWRYFGEGMSLVSGEDQVLFDSILQSPKGTSLVQAYTVSGVRSDYRE